MILPKAQTATLYLQKYSTAPEHSSTLHSNCLIEQRASGLQKDRGREEGGCLCEHRGGNQRCCPTPEGGVHGRTESPNKGKNVYASRKETKTQTM